MIVRSFTCYCGNTSGVCVCVWGGGGGGYRNKSAQTDDTEEENPQAAPAWTRTRKLWTTNLKLNQAHRARAESTHKGVN